MPMMMALLTLNAMRKAMRIPPRVMPIHICVDQPMSALLVLPMRSLGTERPYRRVCHDGSVAFAPVIEHFRGTTSDG